MKEEGRQAWRAKARRQDAGTRHAGGSWTGTHKALLVSGPLSPVYLKALRISLSRLLCSGSHRSRAISQLKARGQATVRTGRNYQGSSACVSHGHRC